MAEGIVELATRFRNVLSRVELYLANKDQYVEQIATLEQELREERDLAGILRDNNVSAFDNIRSAVEGFLAQTDLEAKYARLNELLLELHDVVDRNDEGLRQHGEVGELVARVTEERLARADGIPIRIREINEYLASRGRLGKNPTFTIYSSSSSRSRAFDQQVPNDRQHVRGISANRPEGDHQFYVAGDFVALVRFDVPRGGVVSPDGGQLSLYVDEPRSGCGPLDVFFMNPDNADVDVARAGRDSKGPGPWVKGQGGTAPLTRPTIVGVKGIFNGCHFLTHQMQEDRQQGDEIVLPIHQSALQRMVDGTMPPVFAISSASYMRFDSFRDDTSGATDAFMPRLRFEYQGSA